MSIQTIPKSDERNSETQTSIENQARVTQNIVCLELVKSKTQYGHSLCFKCCSKIKNKCDCCGDCEECLMRECPLCRADFQYLCI